MSIDFASMLDIITTFADVVKKHNTRILGVLLRGHYIVDLINLCVHIINAGDTAYGILCRDRN